jgi:hypothetical protein
MTKRIAYISCSELLEMGPDKEFHLFVDLFCTQRAHCFMLPTYGPHSNFNAWPIEALNQSKSISIIVWS